MSETSASLLDQLRHEPDAAAWGRLVELYTPLIRGWLRRQAALQENDIEDLVQEVLAVVVRKMPDFQREDRTGAFRRWLRTISVNVLRNFWRGKKNHPQGTGASEFLQMLDQLADPDSALSKQWEEEHNHHVTQRLLEMIRPGFEPTTWRAFQRVTLDGADVDVVAQELGITVNAVFIAKSRVLSRLRQEGAGLLD